MRTATPAVRARADEASIHSTAPSTALVWIDSREAVIARWDGAAGSVEHIASDVPAHRSGMGHVRHAPDRHGGGQSQDAADHDRLEHLERFIGQVAARLEVDERIVVIGPGTVREHLERRLRTADATHRRDRLVGGGPAGPMTGRQLIRELREIIGDVPKRHAP